MPELSEFQVTKVTDCGTFAVDPNNPNLTAVGAPPADTSVNIPAQMIARATGVTGNQLFPDEFADKFGILPTPDQSGQNDPAQMFPQILQQMTQSSYSESDGGFAIDWFPTETIRPTESVDDGGFVIYGFPTETVRPIESVYHFELLI